MDYCDPQKADHCTRCREPFAPPAVRFMVSAHLVHYVIQSVVIARSETVPVCGACATLKEQSAATRDETCMVCSCRMLMPEGRKRRAICSNRCEQRERRSRRRSMRWKRCTVCHNDFAPKRRDDALFCTSACRQRACRLRKLADP